MASFRPDTKTLVLAGSVCISACNTAWAWEADAVAESLKTVMATQGVELSWTGVSDDGSSVTLEGVTAGAAGADETLPLGSLTLQDVREEGDRYVVGTFGVDTYTLAEDDFSLAVEDLWIWGLKLPKEGADDPLAGIMLYDRFELASAVVDIGGSPLFAMSDLHAEMTAPSSDGTMEFTGAAEDISVNLDGILPDGPQRATMDELGYTQMKGRVDMAGSWRPSDGRTVVSQYDFAVEDAGTLGMSFDISGYTPEFINAMREMQEQMAAGGEENAQAQGMAMMGLMQQLTFGSATIRFTDDSLTNKLLNFAAEQQGAKPSDFVSMAQVMIPMQLSPFLGAEMAQSVAGAVTTFLNDPQSIEVKAAPEEPVPFAMLMGTAMGAPEELAKQVGLEVIANQ